MILDMQADGVVTSVNNGGDYVSTSPPRDPPVRENVVIKGGVSKGNNVTVYGTADAGGRSDT